MPETHLCCFKTKVTKKGWSIITGPKTCQSVLHIMTSTIDSSHINSMGIILVYHSQHTELNNYRAVKEKQVNTVLTE